MQVDQPRFLYDTWSVARPTTSSSAVVEINNAKIKQRRIIFWLSAQLHPVCYFEEGLGTSKIIIWVLVYHVLRRLSALIHQSTMSNLFSRFSRPWPSLLLHSCPFVPSFGWFSLPLFYLLVARMHAWVRASGCPALPLKCWHLCWVGIRQCDARTMHEQLSHFYRKNGRKTGKVSRNEMFKHNFYV